MGSVTPRLEKFNYMHNNPVRHGLGSSPGEWVYSSWRFYFLQDASSMEMDRAGISVRVSALGSPFGSSQTPKNGGLRQPAPVLKMHRLA